MYTDALVLKNGGDKIIIILQVLSMLPETEIIHIIIRVLLSSTSSDKTTARACLRVRTAHAILILGFLLYGGDIYHSTGRSENV